MAHIISCVYSVDHKYLLKSESQRGAPGICMVNKHPGDQDGCHLRMPKVADSDLNHESEHLDSKFHSSSSYFLVLGLRINKMKVLD